MESSHCVGGIWRSIFKLVDICLIQIELCEFAPKTDRIGELVPREDEKCRVKRTKRKA